VDLDPLEQVGLDVGIGGREGAGGGEVGTSTAISEPRMTPASSFR
jgi:hypothetical protein